MTWQWERIATVIPVLGPGPDPDSEPETCWVPFVGTERDLRDRVRELRATGHLPGGDEHHFFEPLSLLGGD